MSKHPSDSINLADDRIGLIERVNDLLAVSGLEQTQNAMRRSWSREEVDTRLLEIMRSIHARCVEFGREGSFVNYLRGANRGGFLKLADAILAQGVM